MSALTHLVNAACPGALSAASHSWTAGRALSNPFCHKVRQTCLGILWATRQASPGKACMSCNAVVLSRTQSKVMKQADPEQAGMTAAMLA